MRNRENEISCAAKPCGAAFFGRRIFLNRIVDTKSRMEKYFPCLIKGGRRRIIILN